MNKYIIKSVSSNDLEHCAKLIRQGFSAIANNAGITINNYPECAAFTTTNTLIKSYERGNLMYSIYNDLRMVGFIELEKCENSSFKLKRHMVLYEDRNSGYGKALLDYAKNKVKELGGEKLIIDLIDNKNILKDFYKSHGFYFSEKSNNSNIPFAVNRFESCL